MPERRRALIVGGVAGGASCATRLRRLDESCEIVVFDRGPFVSFANCGLPYYVGGVIREEERLLLATPELFRERFRIDVRVESEIVAIDHERREIDVRESATGQSYRERYDVLVLATGAAPVRPPLPGIDLPGIFALRTIPDSRRIREWIEARAARRAVIVGGGFIGLEMAENLAQRGLAVTVVEMAPHVLPPFDAEMTEEIHDHLQRQSVDLHLGDGVARFEEHDGGLVVRTSSGAVLPADLVILAIGVRPEVTLARNAGLALGKLGGVRVDEQMRTNDPAIWAVGDMVEVRDFVTGAWSLIPLAGPANRQGRLAAESIAGRPRLFRGVQGTAVCGLFGVTAALTGATEKSLKRAGIDNYERIYLHPGHHVAYYPGARPIHLKLLFERETGRVLGAQAVGEEGVEKRIDVLAMAIQKGATVFDLEEAELCYAPQFGAAKDPINVAGMVASNVVRGDVALARWEDLAATQALILDVRETAEHAASSISGAVNLPLSALRSRIDELPRDREIWIHCAAGQRSYYAARFLAQNGFRVKNLPGGYKTYQMFRPRS